MKNYQTNKEAYVSRVQPQFSETSDAIDRFSQRHVKIMRWYTPKRLALTLNGAKPQ